MEKLRKEGKIRIISLKRAKRGDGFTLALTLKTGSITKCMPQYMNRIRR